MIPATARRQGSRVTLCRYLLQSFFGTIKGMTSSPATSAAGVLAADHPLVDGRTADSPLITAYRGGNPSRRHVWFMRQAGRSLPEYLKVREGVTNRADLDVWAAQAVKEIADGLKAVFQEQGWVQ